MRVDGEGTRVAMIVEASDAGSVRVEVNAGGGWLPLEERWHEGRVSVLRADLGALYPLASKEDAEFCQFLEMHMRQEAPPLLGRDHLAFRSAHAPARAVADGDLCAQFGALPAERRRAVAAELDRTPAEVLRKLEDLAGRIL